MKHIKIILASLLMIITVNACVKSKDFIDDNSDPTGVGSRPVSTNAFIDLALPRTALEGKAFVAGASFTTELQFISESPVKEIVFYSTKGKLGPRELVKTYPYVKAFSPTKRMDTLIIPYTVPSNIIAGDTLKLDFVIVNQNTLSLTRTVSIKGK